MKFSNVNATHSICGKNLYRQDRISNALIVELAIVRNFDIYKE